jgi:hypothetical protein
MRNPFRRPTFITPEPAPPLTEHPALTGVLNATALVTIAVEAIGKNDADELATYASDLTQIEAKLTCIALATLVARIAEQQNIDTDYLLRNLSADALTTWGNI